MANKKDLKDYISTVKSVKPSAEVKVRTKNHEGEITESIASREYVSKHIDSEIEAVHADKNLSDRLNEVTKRNLKYNIGQPKSNSVTDLDQIEKEIEDEETIQENAQVEFRNATVPEDEEESPLTYVPNDDTPRKSTTELSETALLISLIEKLIDRIDSMQNFNPVIHVPAPVIHVTLPETKRTVTKAIERDEEGFIKTVREQVEEAPIGEPLVETKQPKPTQRKKKRGAA